MQDEAQLVLNSEEWTTIRDFPECGEGFQFPKYEAKYVEQAEGEYVENEIVLVKKIDSISGAERIYHLPKGVFEGVIDHLT